MDIRTALLKEHSRMQAEKIAGWVGRDATRTAELIHLFLHDEYRVVQRAAWLVNLVGERHHDMILPYMADLVRRMTEPNVPVAVKRNVTRLLQLVEIPEILHGEIMNVCFDLLADVHETVAVRCFSMTVLHNLSKIYPDIRQELVTIIEDSLEINATAGFKSRAKKILKK